MNAHTPGPWSIGSWRTSPIPIEASGIKIAGVNLQHDPASVDGWPTEEANARIIAAAPDLLSALENLRNEAVGYLADLNRHGVDTTTLRGAIKQAEAVIVKTK